MTFCGPKKKSLVQHLPIAEARHGHIMGETKQRYSVFAVEIDGLKVLAYITGQRIRQVGFAGGRHE